MDHRDIATDTIRWLQTLKALRVEVNALVNSLRTPENEFALADLLEGAAQAIRKEYEIAKREGRREIQR